MHRKQYGDTFEWMVFPGRTDFHEITFTKTNFHRATFTGRVDFTNATFKYMADSVFEVSHWFDQ